LKLRHFRGLLDDSLKLRWLNALKKAECIDYMRFALLGQGKRAEAMSDP